MGRKGPKILEDFVIPHLNSCTFGKKLLWENRKEGIFLLQWFHKNGPKWSKEENEVFEEWDRLKNRGPECSEDCYETKSKQRFRAALGKKIKENKLCELKYPTKDYKIYKILPACYKHQISNEVLSSPSSSEYSSEYSSSDLEMGVTNDKDRHVIQDSNEVAIYAKTVVEEQNTKEMTNILNDTTMEATSKDEVYLDNDKFSENPFETFQDLGDFLKNQDTLPTPEEIDAEPILLITSKDLFMDTEDDQFLNKEAVENQEKKENFSVGPTLNEDPWMNSLELHSVEEFLANKGYYGY